MGESPAAGGRLTPPATLQALPQDDAMSFQLGSSKCVPFLQGAFGLTEKRKRKVHSTLLINLEPWSKPRRRQLKASRLTETNEQTMSDTTHGSTREDLQDEPMVSGLRWKRKAELVMPARTDRAPQGFRREAVSLI